MGARRLVAGFVALFGAVCCAIAMAHIALGPSAIPGGVVTNATMDSEDRFYATLFGGFGAALIWCARQLAARQRVLEVLLIVFLAAGFARLISAASVGWPGPLFIVLGATELALPPLLWWALRRTT